MNIHVSAVPFSLGSWYMGILRYTFHSMGAPYVLLLVLRNSDVEWCIAVEVMKQECFCKLHLKNTMNVADIKR